MHKSRYLSCIIGGAGVGTAGSYSVVVYGVPN